MAGRMFSAAGSKRASTSSSWRGRRVSKVDHAHCVDLVETRDREGYLCGLLMPSDARRAYFAVRAFNVEIASIKDGTDPRRSSSGFGVMGGGGPEVLGVTGGDVANLPAKLRLQWWREALEEIYAMDVDAEDGSRVGNEAVRNQPVVRSMLSAVDEIGLTRRFLERMLDAREADLDIGQPSTVQELVDYSEETASSLLYLSLECAGVRDDSADLVASHVGVALGLVTALRATAYRASRRGEVSIPAELMRKHTVPSGYLLSPNERVRGEEMSGNDKEADEALRAAVFDLARVARGHLSQARELQGGVPKAGRPSLLPAVGAVFYLEELENVGYDVLHHRLNVGQVGTLAIPLLLGRAWLTGSF